jgi:ribose 5-phosphate isomerase B
MKKKLAIASDHKGVELKENIMEFLTDKKISFIDLGTNSTESVDYPEYSNKLTEIIAEERAQYGILICGTGIGMSIAANRHSRIRAALCFNSFMAQKSRQHNNANVIIIGSQITDKKTTLEMIDVFLSTKFEGGRHQRRLSKIN